MSWSLVKYATAAEYQKHFEQKYCRGPLTTFDGYHVRFKKSDFKHCFFESSRRDGNKDTFSLLRAQRIDWIAATLADGTAQLKAGWDKKNRSYDHNRRVALVKGNYVVVIALTKDKKATFITAYVMDTPESLKKLTAAPQWGPPS